MTKDQKASTAAKTLYEGFISNFGAPKRILTDQGKAFTSEVVGQLCYQFGISSQRKWSGRMSPPDPWKDDRKVGG